MLTTLGRSASGAAPRKLRSRAIRDVARLSHHCASLERSSTNNCAFGPDSDQAIRKNSGGPWPKSHRKVTKQIEAQLRPTLENTFPPGAYRAKLIDLFVANFGPRLTNEVVLPTIEAVYDKKFSDDELKQLIAFYESPLGKKATSVLPEIDAQIPTLQESSEKLAQKCMEQLLAEHPDLAEALEKAEQAHSH